jgi:hypothetical protein
MLRTGGRSLSVLLGELQSAAERQEHEVEALRTLVKRLRMREADLLAELRATRETANNEKRAAARLRAELLSRTSVANERHDFCGDGHETTGVLPLPRPPGRRSGRGDETERVVKSADSRA